MGLNNARENSPYIRKTVLDLASKGTSRGNNSAIVISAGPSLHRRPVASSILASTYKGVIVAADGALGYCLRNGLVPHFVVTVDPHPTRIVRWFGDPALERREHDDYFRRQDLDPALNRDEMARNQELIEIVNRHGPKIKAIISTSAPSAVTKRCLEAGMELYWWNPIYDDYYEPNSYTRRVHELTKVPCMATGGNVGTSAWVFAHSALRCRTTALVGMDLGYPPETPVENTQYYKELAELFGERAREALIKVYNPYLKQTWYTDPAYYWYRQNLLAMVRQAHCQTFNCTEGGILFGKGIRFMPLMEFLDNHSG